MSTVPVLTKEEREGLHEGWQIRELGVDEALNRMGIDPRSSHWIALLSEGFDSLEKRFAERELLLREMRQSSERRCRQFVTPTRDHQRIYQELVERWYEEV